MKKLKLKINERAFNWQFKTIWKDQSDLQVLVGSGGSGKSEQIAAKHLLRLILEKNLHLYGVRKVEKSIRKSQWKLLNDQIKRWGLQRLFEPKETTMELTVFNGNKWSALGLDSREKIKSLTEPDGFWMEEATEFEEDDLDQLLTRLRGYSENIKQIELTFNPIDEYHWLRDRFFPDAVWDKVVKDKFFRVRQEVKIDDDTNETIKILLCHSTYKDNKFLTNKDIARLLMHEKRNPQHFRVYALGQWGRTEGLVYPGGYLIISKEKYPKREDCEIIYGLDFGFTHNTSLSRYYLKKVQVNGLEVLQSFREQLIYEKGLETRDLIAKMKELNIHPAESIYCDYQATEKIRQLEEVEEDGYPRFTILLADKSVSDGIEYLRTVERYSCPENVEANREIKMYRLKMDTKGKYIDGDPIKYLDDAMDDERYALYTHSKVNEVKLAFV